MVDMDPQASLTQAFGRQDTEDRLYNAFTSRAGLPIDQLSATLSLRWTPMFGQQLGLIKV